MSMNVSLLVYFKIWPPTGCVAFSPYLSLVHCDVVVLTLFFRHLFCTQMPCSHGSTCSCNAKRGKYWLTLGNWRYFHGWSSWFMCLQHWHGDVKEVNISIFVFLICWKNWQPWPRLFIMSTRHAFLKSFHCLPKWCCISQLWWWKGSHVKFSQISSIKEYAKRQQRSLEDTSAYALSCKRCD